MNFSIRSLRCPPYCLHVATGDKRRMDTEGRIMNIHTEVVCGSGHSRRVPRGCNCAPKRTGITDFSGYRNGPEQTSAHTETIFNETQKR